MVFFYMRKSHFLKNIFWSLNKLIKFWLSQILIKNTCPDLNLRSIVQIASPLSSNHDLLGLQMKFITMNPPFRSSFDLYMKFCEEILSTRNPFLRMKLRLVKKYWHHQNYNGKLRLPRISRFKDASIFPRV